MTTVTQVLRWDLTQLASAAAALDLLADDLLDAANRSVNVAASDPAWTGVTHDAAHARVRVIAASLKRSNRAVWRAAETARGAQTELTTAQDSLRAAVSSLETNGFTVSPDGSVSHPDPDGADEAAEATSRIHHLVTAAVDLDLRIGSALLQALWALDGSGEQKVMAPDGSMVSALEAALDVSGFPIPNDLTPVQVRAYWESLSPAEQAAMIAADPNAIGNTSGIPFATRIQANRTVITGLLEDAESEHGVHSDEAQRLRGFLSDGRKFISFDPTHQTFAELIGDIDADTENVGVLVPGTGTALDDVDKLHRQALNLSRQSGAPVIVWADTALPQTIVDSPTKRKLSDMAIDPTLAKDGAPALVEFGAELDTELAAVSPQAETTVIGHSYGGSIVGTAEQLGLRADRVVYASSAGTGVLDDREWSNPEPDVKRYSLTPPGDLIQYAQELGGPWHGGDPDDAPGVTRLDTGFYSPDDDGVRELVEGHDAHSGYFDDPGSDGFAAMADAIAGREPTPYVYRAPDMPLDEDIPFVVESLRGAISNKIEDTVTGLVGGLLDLVP